MVFRNIDFHNVAHMEPLSDGSGYEMMRVPPNVRKHLNAMAQENTSLDGTGVELRFQMVDDEVTIILRSGESSVAQVAYVLYGSLQGDWENATKIIFRQDTKIVFKKREFMDVMKNIQNEYALPFDSEVVRLVLPGTKIFFVDVIGEVKPPKKEQLPQKTYLAYGSSITHGALSLCPLRSYVFQVAQNMNADYINLGFSGSAYLEKEMAEYITSLKNWDFASIELGINLLDRISSEEFRNLVKEFTDIMVEDGRVVFCTDMFTSYSDRSNPEKVAGFRKIVKEFAQNRLVYIPGNELMTSIKGLSADFVHPNIDGMEEIAENFTKIMKKHIGQ